MSYYMSSEIYARLVEALANIKPCAVAGVADLDAIKIALGEIGDVWPDSIRDDLGLAIHP